MRKAMILFLLITLPFAVISSEKETKKAEKKKFGAVPLPVVAYTPETSFMFGVTGIGYYNRDPDDEDAVQDSIQLSGIYTLKNQFMGMLRADIYPGSEKVLTSVFLAANKAPEMFFGVGNSNSFGKKETYLKTDVKLRAYLGYEVADDVYLGPEFHFWKMNVGSKKKGGLLETLDPDGAEGMMKIGAGIRLLADRRKGTFYPTGGYITEIRALRYGMNGSFFNFFIDHRHYFNVALDHVLAFQLIYNMNTGKVPFQMMAPLGGEEIMRGYYKGSYLDKCMTAFQVEYRFPVFWRFEATAFFSVGNVSQKPFYFDPERTAFAGGLGLRVMIDRKERIPIRFDVAVNREGRFSYYLSLLQAF